MALSVSITRTLREARSTAKFLNICHCEDLILVGFSESRSYRRNADLIESAVAFSSLVFVLAVSFAASEDVAFFVFRSKKPFKKGGVFQNTKIEAPLKTLLSFIFESNSDSQVLIVGDTLQAKFLLSPFLIIQSNHSSNTH